MFTVLASVNGRYEIRSVDTAHQAVAIVDEWHALGAFPVRIKKNGVIIKSPRELDEMLQAELCN